MVPLSTRRTLGSAAATAVALVLAVSTVHPTAAQPIAADDRQLEQIQEILSRGGPSSLELLEPLTSLGLLYQESEDYTLAIVTMERAMHIVRVNAGLHSLEQVPLMRQLIRLEEARGNDAGGWEREQELLTLLRRYPDDIRTVPVLRDIADKQMRILAAVLSGQRPPQVVLGCFYDQWATRAAGACNAGNVRTVVQGMLAEAQRNYADAIGVMLRQGQYGSPDLRALELEVLRGVDLVRSLYYRGRELPLPMVPGVIGADNIEPWRSRITPLAALANWELPYPDAQVLDEDDGRHVATKHLQIMHPYHRGRQSLRRLYAYGAASSSSLQQADAVVQMADWDLLYAHNSRAIASYGVALAMLEQAGAASASMEEQLFGAATPVVLPAFQPNPLARDEEREPTGHIDVAFEITKYGRGRAIEFLGDENASDAAKQDLAVIIKNNRFRPRLTGGQLADVAPVKVRYYLY